MLVATPMIDPERLEGFPTLGFYYPIFTVLTFLDAQVLSPKAPTIALVFLYSI